MTGCPEVTSELRRNPRSWLVTGAAGFVGSNLVERLLELGQRVVGIDNFATGHRRNLEEAVGRSEEEAGGSFRFVEGDVRDLELCRELCRGTDYVLHQAALGSVPRSLEKPLATHEANATGSLTVLVAARDEGVGRVVYASSSSCYGDHEALPKVEGRVGKPVSPYGASKYVGELYAQVFSRSYGMEAVGLRYFNVFGRRQDVRGPYAAVIPKWVGSLLRGETCHINGDGETSRDFCYVDNVVQANLRAATADLEVGPDGGLHEVYNVAVGERTTLNELFRLIRDIVARHEPAAADARPEYRDFRPGDIRHSEADIGKIRRELGYRPTHDVEAGLEEAIAWYLDHQPVPARGHG
jgi:UDP-N-acetylglucosamine 4-epimerase